MTTEQAENQSTAEQIATLEKLSQGSVAWLTGLSPRSIRDAVTLKRSTDGTYDGRQVVEWAASRIPAPDLSDGELERLLTVSEHLSLVNEHQTAAAIEILTTLRSKYGDAALALLGGLLLKNLERFVEADEAAENNVQAQKARERFERQARENEANRQALRITSQCRCGRIRCGREWVKRKPPSDHLAIEGICPTCESSPRNRRGRKAVDIDADLDAGLEL